MKPVYIRCDTREQLLVLLNRQIVYMWPHTIYYYNVTTKDYTCHRPQNARIFHYWKAQELYPELFI